MISQRGQIIFLLICIVLTWLVMDNEHAFCDDAGGRIVWVRTALQDVEHACVLPDGTIIR